MNSSDLSVVWLQVLALLALEAGLIALGVALLRRWCQAAAWGRLFAQAGIAAVLLITAGELSGAARSVAGWAVDAIARRSHAGAQSPAESPVPLVRAEARPRAGALPGERLGVEAGAPLPAPLTSSMSAREGTREPGVAQVSRPAVSPTSKSAQPPEEPRVWKPAIQQVRAPALHGGESTAVSDSMLFIWVGVAWVVGAMIVLGRSCFACCLFSVFGFRRRPVAEASLAERVRTMAQALGMRRRVRVLESEHLATPIAFGLFRPTVGIPLNFSKQFDAVRRDAILAHEVAHLAAHDPFWCFLADIASAILWWHPAVWWMRRQLHTACEFAADEASLLVADGPAALAECLVELGTRLSRRPVPGHLGMANFRSHLGCRVQRLVRMESRAWSPPRRLRPALFRILGSAAMVAVVVVCTAWVAPRALTEGDGMKSMRLNWKRSLATFALLASFSGPAANAAGPDPAEPPEPPAAPATLAAPKPETPAPPAVPQAPRRAPQPERGLPHLVVTNITPLYLRLTLESVSASETGASYRIGVEQEASANGLGRRKRIVRGEEGRENDVFTFKSSEGDPKDPASVKVVVELNDTGKRAVLSTEKPFERNDGYMADLWSDVDHKVFLKKRVGAAVPVEGVDYEIASITRDEVVLRGPEQKKVTLKYNRILRAAGVPVDVAIPVEKLEEYKGICEDLESLRRREKDLRATFTSENVMVKDARKLIADKEKQLSALEHDYPALARLQQEPGAPQDPFSARYGLRPGPARPPAPAGGPAMPPRPEVSKGKARIEAKLDQMVLPEVTFVGLPLEEVLRVLNDRSVKLDPEHNGVNFLITTKSPPVPKTGLIDPSTGLPVPGPTEVVDPSAILIKFSLPLRHVTMREVLNAVVKVADHPIAYTVEDYAVVFSPVPEYASGQAAVVPQPGFPGMARPWQTAGPQSIMPPPGPETGLSQVAEEPSDSQDFANVKPERFNVDFGPWRPGVSKQQGPAAAGAKGDFWNAVGVPWNDHHTEGGLRFANEVRCPIRVEMINLGGGWGSAGGMGIESPMLDDFSYPAGNKGGDSKVILHRVPPGKYSVYIYGHGLDPLYYGDYTLTVGDHNYGRKSTSHKWDAVKNTKWVEGSQYVRFSGVKVAAGENIEILIRPGQQVTTPDGRNIADAIICGLQLVPAR